MCCEMLEDMVELGFDSADEVGFSALLGADGRRLCFPVVELTSFSAEFAALFDAELGFDGADEVGVSALLGANGRPMATNFVLLDARSAKHEQVGPLRAVMNTSCFVN